MPAPYDLVPVVSAPFDQNAFVLRRRGSAEAIVVDPGFDVAALARALKGLDARPVAIVNTHGHVDHIAGNVVMRDMFPDLPILIGRNDAAMLTDPQLNLSAKYGLPVLSPPADRLLDDGETLELAGFSFLVREIPGHSPGSIVLIAQDEDPPFAIVGDVLFSGSIGRTDFPNGDGHRLVSGIHSILMPLPDPTLVYSGHGPETTIGRERESNPFL